jgi:hypothetical protein
MQAEDWSGTLEEVNGVPEATLEIFLKREFGLSLLKS